MGRLCGTLTRAGGLLLTLLLVGCGGLYQAPADLSQAVPLVQPIEAGSYVTQGSDATTIDIQVAEDGSYRLTDPTKSEELQARIFGPVGGLYVAQILPEGDKQGLFGYAIIKVDVEGIHLADDTSDLMGALLFTRLGVPAPRDGAQVNGLTDNAWLNWALLQELIVKHKDQLVFQPLYVPVAP